MTSEIGPRIRALRLAHGRTLVDVAYAARVTKGFLSQLERGLTHASLATLARIAGALDAPLAELFQEPTSPEPSSAPPRLTRHHPLSPDRALTPDGLHGLEAVESTVPAGATSGGETLDAVPTAHLVLVREGRFTVHVDGTPYRLAAGDSLAFGSPPAYAWRNDGPQPVRLVWVLSPPRRLTRS